jgi:hypothetical protein
MKLDLHRHQSADASTLGTLAINGEPCCFTLEDRVREIDGVPVAEWKVPGQTAIPRGTYPVVVTPSARFGRDQPLLVGVPGFEGIRIHPGNTAADTEGCILVGFTTMPGFIGRSRDAFAKVFALISAARSAGETVTITIV